MKHKRSGKLTMEQIKDLIDENITDLYQLQESLERDCYKATSQKLHLREESLPSIEGLTSMNSDLYQSLMRQWFVQLTDQIMKSTSFLIYSKSFHHLSKSAQFQYRNLFKSLDPDRIALVCLQEITRVSSFDPEHHRVPALKLAVSIGNSLLREILIEKAANISMSRPNEISPRYLSELIRKSEIMSNYTTRKQYSEFLRDIQDLQSSFPKSNPLRGVESSWSYKTNIEIGMNLIYQTIYTCHLPKTVVSNNISNFAFQHKIVSSGINRRGFIEMNPVIYELLINQPRPIVLEPWSLPMLVPPKPWLTHNNGGYLLHSTNCVRLRAGDIHLDRLQSQDKNGSLHRILSGLDVLGQTSWRINNNILSVIEDVQQSNDTNHTFLDTQNSAFSSFMESSTEEFPEIQSPVEIKWEQNFKIEIAKLFSNLTFYLPHSLDFRGRAYPIAPYLSVVGDDLSRGLLLYGEGKKLGPRGWYWLRVHLANTADYSKGKTYDERVHFTDRHLADILDSANNPLTGRQWWRNCGSSTPWQCLAACFEIRNALSKGNPEEYISHLPISQDGSCNGLQHYAALGKDSEGAYAVNLTPSLETNQTMPREQQRPQDIYLHVAKCVSSSVALEAAQHRHQRSHKVNSTLTPDDLHISEILNQKISSRSLYKRIVMTSVYGVTPYTARIHLTEYLLQEQIVPPNRIIEAALYLVDKIFEALYSSLFQRAKEIQDWLTTVATEIGRSVPPTSPLLNLSSCESATYPQTFLSWTTPLGFQVTQPYIVPLPPEQHQTALQKISFSRPYSSYLSSSSTPTSTLLPPVDIQKQSSSFPPNFIHSLDATHMFMTALACYNEANLTSFAAVHDSYYSHASDYEILQKILKQQFISLYSQPILENLRNELLDRYQEYKIPLHDIPIQPRPKTKYSKYSFQYQNIFRKFPLSWQKRERTVGRSIQRSSIAESWRNISFPPIPRCGNLNISHVATSEYFFN